MSYSICKLTTKAKEMTNLEEHILNNHANKDKELDIQDDAMTLENTISEIEDDKGPHFDDLYNQILESELFEDLAKAFARRNESEISKISNDIRIVAEYDLKLQIESIAVSMDIDE